MVPALDRWLPDFDVHKVHAVTVPDAPEAALARALVVRAAPDRIVRTLFRLRGVRGGDLPLERFAQEVLRLEQVERTPTTAVAVGSPPRLRLGILFAAEPVAGGSRLVTETRVTATRPACALPLAPTGSSSAPSRHSSAAAGCRPSPTDRAGRGDRFGSPEGRIGRSSSWSSVASMLSVLCCENRQRTAGTRRVHQLGHARARAGTADTPSTSHLQEKRDRECPAVYASTAWETSMVRRGSTVRVRQRACIKCLQISTLLLSARRTRGHIPDTFRYARRNATSRGVF
jgi:hypothetical protein